MRAETKRTKKKRKTSIKRTKQTTLTVVREKRRKARRLSSGILAAFRKRVQNMKNKKRP